MINISICLSDIPADARKKSETNGKFYANFVVDERKEVDKFGNTHSVAISMTKEERQAGKQKVYVGSGKEFIFNNQQQNKKPDYVQLPDEDPDSLPF